MEAYNRVPPAALVPLRGPAKHTEVFDMSNNTVNPLTTEERFWAKVVKTDGCWIWTSARNHKGYGRFANAPRPNRKVVLAHRFSWEIEHGEIPPGLLVLHHCDIPECVRPSHLFLGTNQDNVTDMINKGRDRQVSRPGENNPNAKLTIGQVHAIRSTPIIKGDPEYGYSAIARKYGVTHQQIMAIVSGRQWRDQELQRKEAS
jgi:hypothetical protein